MTATPRNERPAKDRDAVVDAFAKRTRNRIRGLTLREARRAIVLDFEGGGRNPNTGRAPPPAVLGALVPAGRDSTAAAYVAYVLDPGLHLLARARLGPRRTIVVASLADAVADVLRRARAHGGRLVTWFSEHEASVLAPLLAMHADLAPMKEIAFDAKAVMDRARARLRPRPENADRTLESYARLFGFSEILETQDQRDVRPATVLRELRKALSGLRRFGRAPAAVRQRARDLFEYNRLDCVMTRECLLAAWRDGCWDTSAARARRTADSRSARS